MVHSITVPNTAKVYLLIPFLRPRLSFLLDVQTSYSYGHHLYHADVAKYKRSEQLSHYSVECRVRIQGMFGQMMRSPLLMTSFIDRSADLFSKVEIVSRLADRSIHRYTYGACRDRAYRLAAALQKSGIRPGDRVGTLMWNHYAHLEAYFGIPLAGAVLHTLNLRLHPQEIARIASHAGDRIVIVDNALLPLWEQIAEHFRPERVIVADISGNRSVSENDYETLLENAPKEFNPVRADEDDAVGLCYTSGTTGFPKGILYSHRSVALHSLSMSLPDVLGLRQADVILPVVPMFHVNCWGLPFTAAMLGAKLVLPGPCLDPASILDLFRSEHVTFSAGVPTVWMGILRQLENCADASALLKGMRMLVGGSAVSETLIRGFEAYGARLIQGWGLTETSPLATIGGLKSYMDDWPHDEQVATACKQGLPVPFIEIRTVNTEGICPKDGQTMGEVHIRGPWVASGYFEWESDGGCWTQDGWFRTGDVGTID